MSEIPKKLPPVPACLKDDAEVNDVIAQVESMLADLGTLESKLTAMIESIDEVLAETDEGCDAPRDSVIGTGCAHMKNARNCGRFFM